MKLLVLDAEYNQPSRKTIQIGAAVFDSKSGQMIDSLEINVNPGEPINPEIVTLTGITDRDAKNGVSFLDAFEELRRMHEKHKCFRNPLVWGSGYSNDSLHLYKEYRAASGLPVDEDYQQTGNFMGFRVIDVKTIYQSVQIYENSQYAGGLDKCLEKVGLQFEGDKHRALNDAINTFRMWHYLMRVFHAGKHA